MGARVGSGLVARLLDGPVHMFYGGWGGTHGRESAGEDEQSEGAAAAAELQGCEWRRGRCIARKTPARDSRRPRRLGVKTPSGSERIRPPAHGSVHCEQQRHLLQFLTLRLHWSPPPASSSTPVETYSDTVGIYLTSCE